MDHLDHNRRAWNRHSNSGSPWCVPVDADTVRRARAGDWSVVLTPVKSVPTTWFGDLRGRDVLCLASGGGQQAPILAAAGARVVSFDLSDEQLEKDRSVAERDGLPVRCERGDMADLSRFADDSFDLVFHPCSNAFVPDVRVVWRECHRVLRPGGELLAGFVNPDVFLFDHDEADASRTLVVKYGLPYADVTNLDRAAIERKVERGQPLEYGHTFEDQFAGQIDAGFDLVGFYEDRWFDDTWFISCFTAVAFATRARKSSVRTRGTRVSS